MNKKKILKTSGKISAGLLVFAGSLATAYLLTPNKVKKAGIVDDPGETSTDHFNNFIQTFMNDTGISETTDDNRTREYYGMNASFENFGLSFKLDGKTETNEINIDGNLDFLMKGLHDINFNLNTEIDYNGRNLSLEVGLVNSTAYLGIQDIRMKMGSATLDDLFGDEEDFTTGSLYQYFLAATSEGGINLDIERLINENYNKLVDSLFGGLDLSSLTSSTSFNMTKLEEDEEGIGFDISESQIDTGWKFPIGIQIHTKNEDETMTKNDFTVTIYTDKEYRLTKVDLGTITFNNFTIHGAINIKTTKETEDNPIVLAPTDENSPAYNDKYNYIEVVNYKGWLQKFAKFLGEDNQKFGFEFGFDFKSGDTNIGSIDGSLNADFSDLIDLTEYAYQPVENDKPEGKVLVDEEKEENKVLNIINKVKLGMDISITGQGGEYSNLVVKYVDGDGLISLNANKDDEGNVTSTLSAKIEAETINWLVNEMPSLFTNDTSTRSVRRGNTTTEDASKGIAQIFSFLTDSDFVNGIKSGNFAVILDLLKTVKNDDKTITITLDLSSIGLGDNAEIDLVLDSRVSEEIKVLNIDIKKVQAGSLELNAKLNSNGFKDVEILESENDFDSLNFLPGVIEQISGIAGKKQAGFEIEKLNVLDSDNLGVKISGKGQFDYGTKFGFGNLTIDQYKYKNKGLFYSHKIALDVDNNENYNTYFTYGDLTTSNNIKGKISIKSLGDIVDVIYDFILEAKDDPKFNKFLDPIVELLSMGELSEIINAKDYFKLLQNNYLLKGIKQSGDTINITISGSLFSLENDITIGIVVDDEEGIKSLVANNLDLSGKTLDLKINLVDFDENMTSPINHSDTFMDFDSLSVLLKFGINTTKNNYYHLSAKIDLSALAIINLDFEVEVYIVVKNAYVKVYGVIPDAKISSIAQNYGITARSVKSEFTFETYENNSDDRIGGYFHIKTTEKYIFSTTIKHYISTSDNFIASENILTYLLNDLLLVRTSITNLIGDVNLSSDEEKEAGDYTNLFTDTGFKYDENANRWDIGINLGEITGVDALRELELSLYGNQDESFSKLYVNLNVKASLVTINIGADIVLKDTNTSTEADFTTGINSAFNAINSVTDYTYLNQPTKYLSK